MGNILGAATYCRGKGSNQGQSLDPDDLIEKMGDFMEQFKEITDAACEMSRPEDRRSTDRLATFLVLQKEDMDRLVKLHDRLLHVIVPDDPTLAEKVADEKKRRAETMLSRSDLTSGLANVQLRTENHNVQMQSVYSDIAELRRQIEEARHTGQCVTHLQEQLAASSRREQILKEFLSRILKGSSPEEAAEAFATEQLLELGKILRSMRTMTTTIPSKEVSESKDGDPCSGPSMRGVDDVGDHMISGCDSKSHNIIVSEEV